MSENRSSASSN
jgi:hypothetical protein